MERLEIIREQAKRSETVGDHARSLSQALDAIDKRDPGRDRF
jgi:hypothetical protein